MDQKNQILSYLPKTELKAPASPEAIDNFEHQFMALPLDYKTFLSITNGLEGEIGDYYVRLFNLKELQETYEDKDEQEFFPGLLTIGTDGGGEKFSYKIDEEMNLYLVPAIGEFDEDGILIAYDFMHLLKRLSENEDIFDKLPPKA